MNIRVLHPEGKRDHMLDRDGATDQHPRQPRPSCPHESDYPSTTDDAGQRDLVRDVRRTLVHDGNRTDDKQEHDTPEHRTEDERPDEHAPRRRPPLLAVLPIGCGGGFRKRCADGCSSC
jgi:hypothetical protein